LTTRHTYVFLRLAVLISENLLNTVNRQVHPEEDNPPDLPRTLPALLITICCNAFFAREHEQQP